MPNNILITKILKVNVTAMLVINIKLMTSETLVTSVTSVTAMAAMTEVSHIDWIRCRSRIASRGHQGPLLIV